MRKPDAKSPAGATPDRQPDGDAEALKARLEALKTNLGDALGDQPGTPGGRAEGAGKTGAAGDGGAIGTGLRAGSELLSGVIVGGGIGYLLDRQTGLSPLFLIIFLMLGMVAGFWNVYRLARRTGGGDTHK